MAWLFVEGHLRNEEEYLITRAALVCFFLITFCALIAVPAARSQSVRASSPAVQSAMHQFETGDYSGSIAALRNYLAQNANDAQGELWVGRNYFELRNYDQAIAAFERATQIEPQDSDFHDWLGRAYGEKADKAHSFFLARRVKKEFLDAVRLDGSNLTARRDLEEYCIEAPWIIGGSFDEAKEQADAIAAIDPLSGYLAQANYYEEAVKKLDLAENEYRLVLDADPKSADAYLEAANFFIKQNKPDVLQTYIDAAVKIAPSDPRLSYYDGVQRVESNRDLDEAEQYLKSYLASTPDRSSWPPHAAAREWLGRLYEQQGKTGEAAEQYRAALQLDPQRHDARARLEQLAKAAYY